MKGRSNQVLKKIKNKVGASLAETLVTVLIMSIVMMTVAGAAVVVQRVYKEVRIKADAQTLLSTVVMSMSEDMYYATDISGSDKDCTFFAENRRYYMKYASGKVKNDKENEVNTIQRVVVNNGENERMSGVVVEGASDTYNVVSGVAHTLGLNVYLDSLAYADGVFTFSVSVKDSNNTVLAKKEGIKVRSMLVTGL